MPPARKTPVAAAAAAARLAYFTGVSHDPTSPPPEPPPLSAEPPLPSAEPPPLSAASVAQRRAAQRARRRQRHRLGAGAVVALALLAIVVAVGLGGSGRSVAHPRASSPSPLSSLSSTGATSRLRFSPHALSPAQQARVNDRILAYTSYVAVGSPRRRDLALTFDDGPSPWTPKILAVLRRWRAAATFFEIGSAARTYPRYTAALVRAGMAVENHTETHPLMARLTLSAQALQIDQAQAAIVAAGAPPPLLFRPPYGSFDAETLAALRGRHMVMVLWSADTKDYSQPGVARIRYTAISAARPGAIILFHDGGGPRAQTLAALPRIIARLRQLGFHLVTVPQLLHDDPPPHGQAQPRRLAGG